MDEHFAFFIQILQSTLMNVEGEQAVVGQLYPILLPSYCCCSGRRSLLQVIFIFYPQLLVSRFVRLLFWQCSISGLIWLLDMTLLPLLPLPLMPSSL